MNKKFAEAYNYRGRAYTAMGKHDEAISDYTQAIELNPNSAESYYNRGFSYVRKIMSDKNSVKQDYEKAIPDFTKAIQLNPAHSCSYLYRSLCYNMIGDYDKYLLDGDMYKKLGSEKCYPN